MFLTDITNINDKKWLPGRGNPKASIMVIGTNPNHEDLQAGAIYWNSAAGRELQKALDACGIKVEDIWLTTMVKYGIGSKPKLSGEQIKECAAYLDAEIEAIKPKLIIALGAEVFKRVMKANIKVSPYLGEIIECPYGCKVLANHSPGTIFAQDPTKRPQFQEIFLLGKEYVGDNLNYTPYTYHVIDDVDTAKAVVDHYVSRGLVKVGYDAEWFGKKFTDDEVMHTFQFSCEPHVGWILDISKDGYTENHELLNTVKPLICHPDAWRMGWNIRADDKRLVHRGFELPEHTLKMDGMKAVAFFDSRWGKGLETGIKKFTPYKPYYTELSLMLRKHHLDYSEMSKLKFLEPDVFYAYCGGDAVAHRTACLNMIDHFPAQHVQFFKDVYLPLSNYLLDLEITGIPVDTHVMGDITKKYADKYEELHTDLMEILTAHRITEFNPNSAPQKKKLLFETLKMTPVYYTKSGKSPKPRAWYEKQKAAQQALYSPSTNGKSLSTMVFELQTKIDADELSGVKDEETLLKHRVINTMLNLNRVSVFANKFLSQRGVNMEDIDMESLLEEIDEFEGDEEDDAPPAVAGAMPTGEEPLKQSYWGALCKDNRIHADFFECLKNFRSSSRPNMQNMASKVLSHIPKIFVPDYDKLSKELKKFHDENTIPKNIRNIFWAGNDNFRWVEVDIAGADLMIAAYLSGDPNYIKDMLEGGFHLKKAREYFNDPTVSKDDYSKYVSAKSITFRVAYTSALESAALPIQAEIFAESGNIIPLDTIKYALNTWLRYNVYMDYRERCNAMVKENGYIENARGMRLNFESTDNGSIMGGYMNESLAFPIASELALFMWDISVQMRAHFKKEKLWMKYVYPANTVHDANYFIAHKDLMKDNYFPEVCKYFFTEKVRIATGDALGMEMSVGSRWKDKKPEFTKETRWNFATACWEWKD
jgi:uracil-DNA glycosylase family 4